MLLLREILVGQVQLRDCRTLRAHRQDNVQAVIMALIDYQGVVFIVLQCREHGFDRRTFALGIKPCLPAP